MTNYLNLVIPIIVTYNPNHEVLGALLDSMSLFKRVKLVDNGSRNFGVVTDLCLKHKNIQVSFLSSNCGIADAQNRAVELIEDVVSESAFIMLFDQDSVPVDNCVEILYDYATRLAGEDVRLGVIGPALLDTYSDSRFGFIKNGQRFYKEESISNFFKCDGINSSGSLIPLAVWKELGGNNSQLFIDHVETDWCFRARAAGYVCYGTFDATMSHSMGESTLRYWLFGWRTMPDRTPERHYYLFRNSIFLLQQDYVPREWKFSNVMKLLLTVLYFSLFSADRSIHFTNMYKGLFDGFSNRLGKKLGYV